jgi:hypothetical protein
MTLYLSGFYQHLETQRPLRTGRRVRGETHITAGSLSSKGRNRNA